MTSVEMIVKRGLLSTAEITLIASEWFFRCMSPVNTNNGRNHSVTRGRRQKKTCFRHSSTLENIPAEVNKLQASEGIRVRAASFFCSTSDDPGDHRCKHSFIFEVLMSAHVFSTLGIRQARIFLQETSASSSISRVLNHEAVARSNRFFR